MALVSQRAYARARGLSQEAVRKRTVAQGGPIPTYGRAKQIDSDEADALWEATMAPNGIFNSRFRAPAGTNAPKQAAKESPTMVAGSELARARAAALVVDVQVKRLTLEQRRGTLISRDKAVRRCFAFARLFRDTFLTWPARVGPIIAAALDVDATTLTLALETHIRE
jgi:hypothetical protein